MAFPLDHATPAEWVGLVERDPNALLADHAHCELKAAASAHALIAKNPGHLELARALAEVAIEEMEHFRIVLDELEARGGALGEQSENVYAAALHRGSAATRTSLVLDRLVLAHLIEARSLERFHLLSHHATDERLRALFAGLLPSEAAHQGLYERFARRLFGRETADERIAALRRLEGEVMRGLPFAHTVHSGMVGAPERVAP
ncbi:MAG: tRNA isopentenyl-2-thiomethyl-A-37 hydroxylase MiaE [Planctomycetota bacterium]